MKKPSYIIIAMLIAVSMLISSNVFAKKDGPTKMDWEWQWTSAVGDNPDLRHYYYELARPPYGPFNKIGLHRIVAEEGKGKKSRDKRKVFFMIPGTYGAGDAGVTDENVEMNVYLANRGYDVYSIAFRTEQLPPMEYEQFEEYGIDISTTADWSYAVFRDDIKACVDKAKKLSKAKKVFMGGFSRGVTFVLYYAAKYWKKDLRGLIGLDGSIPSVRTPNPARQLTEEEYLAAVEDFKENGTWLSEISQYERTQFAAKVPYAPRTIGYESLEDDLLNSWAYPIGGDPPPGFEIETVSDMVAYEVAYTYGGNLSRYFYEYPGGDGETYMDLDVLVKIKSASTRHWPSGRQSLESRQIGAYGDRCPFLDLDDQIWQVDLPIIYFESELFCGGGWCIPTGDEEYRVASTDITINYVEGFGHFDIMWGTHSLEKVHEPLLEWMNDRLK